METQITQHSDARYPEDFISNDSAVSWCAVFAGAVASAALSLILLFLGTGFGLTLVSPWSSEGISAGGFGISSILGITVISLLASAMGGYLAGRLRTRWTNTPKDEVFFRDTAHGFLSWSVATLGTAALLTTVIGVILGGGVKAGTEMADGVTATALVAHNNNKSETSHVNNSPLPYLLDSLLRKNTNDSPVNNSPSPVNPETPPLVTDDLPSPINHYPKSRNPKRELTRIFIHAVISGSLPENDLKYAGLLVAQHSNLEQQIAEKRVADTFTRLQTQLHEAETKIKEAADKARKASAYTSLWFFISLLSGAFIASLMAVCGGRQRDL